MTDEYHRTPLSELTCERPTTMMGEPGQCFRRAKVMWTNRDGDIVYLCWRHDREVRRSFRDRATLPWMKEQPDG